MKKVLVIEDDVNLQEVYQEFLATEKLSVFIASTGQLGMQMARSEQPHLIILDIMLPGAINGLEVLKKLKEESDLKQIPVLVLTNLSTARKQKARLWSSDLKNNHEILLRPVYQTKNK
ncbi:MAG: ATP-binding region ATPase domain protein [Candidatus Gottesmanbacteria bacterium GW2011_GWC1_43_10]|nr:MAG: ATP-binding region ATPase domain protein [Candidatus Gottesmanbacteria bacterium GW2011_GWC1_43_10]